MEWIPVSQPPMQPDENVVFDQTDFLVTDGEIVRISTFARGHGAGKPWASWCMYDEIPAEKIKFWMPFPKPPSM